jgi:hypothetical protein
MGPKALHNLSEEEMEFVGNVPCPRAPKMSVFFSSYIFEKKGHTCLNL